MAYQQGQKPETKEKIQLMAEYVKANYPVKQSELKEKFHCHGYTAAEAMKLAGYKSDAGRRRAKRDVKKFNAIVEFLKENGYHQQTIIMEKFQCGKDMASRAAREAGYDGNKAKGLPGIAKLGQNPKYIAKLEKLIADIKGDPEVLKLPKAEMLRKFKCGNESIQRALAVIQDGMDIQDAIMKYARVAKIMRDTYHQDGKVDKEDATMYRPNGRNLLTERWVA